MQLVSGSIGSLIRSAAGAVSRAAGIDGIGGGPAAGLAGIDSVISARAGAAARAIASAPTTAKAAILASNPERALTVVVSLPSAVGGRTGTA
jgi:hypothetical protein